MAGGCPNRLQIVVVTMVIVEVQRLRCLKTGLMWRLSWDTAKFGGQFFDLVIRSCVIYGPGSVVNPVLVTVCNPRSDLPNTPSAATLRGPAGSR